MLRRLQSLAITIYLCSMLVAWVIPVRSEVLPSISDSVLASGENAVDSTKKPDSPAKTQVKKEEDPEVTLGRENAEQNDKTVKLVTTPALVDRVNKIGQKIAVFANELDVPALWGDPNHKVFKYSFKVVDDKDVNAYSLPGGFIYVHTGLLDFVHSDDELAGVLAHEVAHAAHHHMLKLIKENNKMQPGLVAIIVALLASKSSTNDMGNWLTAAQLYIQAKISNYGVEAEKDADNAGAIYMMKAGYNPVGLLTFMERLARKDVLSPEREMGIYRTHPPSNERVAALLAELKSMDIPLERRKVDPQTRAEYASVSLNGANLTEIKMSGTLVARLAGVDVQNVENRGKLICDRLNESFDNDLMLSDLRINSRRTGVMARGKLLFEFTRADADSQQQTTEQLARGTLEAIKAILWQERFNRAPSTAKSN